MNLALVDTSYSYHLNNNLDEIRKKAADDTVTLQMYKNFIHSIVKRANVTKAQQRFISNVYTNTSKNAIMIYCIRAINKAGRPSEWNS